MSTIVQQFLQQAPRLQRDNWTRPSDLANELYAILTSLTEPGTTATAAAAGAAQSGLDVRLMRLDAVASDYLQCTSVDGAETFLVAKPFKLRQTPFDGKIVDGISYTYATPSLRTATQTPFTEDQLVIPKYLPVVPDLIYAVRVPNGTGVLVSNQELFWLDLNVDGRTWARILPA